MEYSMFQYKISVVKIKSMCRLNLSGLLRPWNIWAVWSLRSYPPTFDFTFPLILGKVCSLLANCHLDLHSWFGHCNIVKMCILPKFLYLFQALPIRTPLIYFKQAYALLYNFILACGRPLRFTVGFWPCPSSSRISHAGFVKLWSSIAPRETNKLVPSWRY